MQKILLIIFDRSLKSCFGGQNETLEGLMLKLLHSILHIS